MNDQNQNPNPTIPNQDVFNNSQLNQQSNLNVEKETMDKKQILSGFGGSKISPKFVFIILGVLIFLLLGAVLIKTFNSNSEDKEVILTWWGLQEDEVAVKPLIDEYKQKNPKVTVNFVHQSAQDYRERLSNALQQGKGPDIFEYHNSWVPMFSKNLASTKEDFSNMFYPVVSNDLRKSNGFVGVPLQYDGIALFVNTDLLQTYGKNPPKTWDDFRDIAQQLTVREQDGKIRQSGAAIGTTDNISYWQDILSLLFLQNGADLSNPNSPSGVNTLTYYTNFSKLDKVWNETLPSSQAAFANGSVAMFFGKYSDVFAVKRENPNLKFVIVPVPQLPTNTATIPSVSYASYWVNGVSNKSSNSKEAFEFLKFMSTSESLKKLNEEEIKIRGYGILSPRVDMQNEMLTDTLANPFIYQAGFSRSFYLYGNTGDGVNGINSKISAPFKKAIDNLNKNSQADTVATTLQTEEQVALAEFGLIGLPKATPR